MLISHFSFIHPTDALFAVADVNLNAKLLIDVLGQMLRTIDAAVLTTSAAEREHEGREAALDVAAHVGIGQSIDAFEEGQYLAIVLQETDDRLVETGQLLVGLVTAGVVGGTAVEHVSAAIA